MNIQQDEKLKKIFWLRPAFLHQRQRRLWGIKLHSFKNSSSLTLATTALLLFFFVLLVSLSVLAGWFDHLGDFSSISYENALKFFDKATIFHPPLPLEQHHPLDCIAWEDQNKSCSSSTNNPTTYEPTWNRENPNTCPDYFRWIHEDLKPWKETGITREMVDRATEPGRAHIRVVILDGRKVYVERFKVIHPTRESFTTWGILQLLRLYPGRLPDLELMFDFDDRPVIPSKDYRGPNAGPPPLFRYCSDSQNLDIVFPDWTYWGWPETNIRPWRNTLKEIKEGNKKVSWKEREPYAYWRGNPDVAAWRGELMTCNLTDNNDWHTRLFIQNWEEEMRAGFNQSNIADQCTYRYKIYIEGYGWSVSEKYIFACDSPVLLITPRWHDFFIRGMLPQRHYWPVKDNDKCRSLKFAVEFGNNHTEKAEAIGAAGSRFIYEDMKMEHVYDYIFHLLNEYAKLLKFKPTIPPNAIELCPESMACRPADENWRKYMEDSLEASPSNTLPCRLPSPYDLEALKAFNDQKFKLTKQVEMWEAEYWNKQVKNE